MKRYEYAELQHHPAFRSDTIPGIIYYDAGTYKPKAPPLLVILNELGAQGWRVSQTLSGGAPPGAF